MWQRLINFHKRMMRAPARAGDAKAAPGQDLAIAIGTRELVLIVAGLWALNAFAIDMMLPALGVISANLGAQSANDRQLIIVVYLIFNGFAQVIFGPVVDRFGRRSVLLWALVAYVIASLFSVLAPTFGFMLAARAMQGVTTAATRVAALALIRDRFAGRSMAQVMSLIMTIYMAAPIIAPAFGQVILVAGSWRLIFAALLLYGAVLGGFVFFRIAETMPREAAKPLKMKTIIGNYLFFFRNRISFGYTFGNAFVFAGLFAYISASEQIFLETFELGNLFAVAFASVAFSVGIATITNARLVKSFGMRRVSHGALIVFVLSALAHWGVNALGHENIYTFLALMAVSFFSLGLIGPNYTAIAMEPMGHIAGSAGAANGFVSTALSGLIGGAIARGYDGTVGPILTGMVALSVASLILTLITERGRLFEPLARIKPTTP
ncbi:MAG: multidrug effflux MFS transporter [Pseudomonadota bacterium]